MSGKPRRQSKYELGSAGDRSRLLLGAYTALSALPVAVTVLIATLAWHINGAMHRWPSYERLPSTALRLHATVAVTFFTSTFYAFPVWVILTPLVLWLYPAREATTRIAIYFVGAALFIAFAQLGPAGFWSWFID